MKNVISRVKGSQPAPILLVANKLDLECQREVATSEGMCQTFYLYIYNSTLRIIIIIYRYGYDINFATFVAYSFNDNNHINNDKYIIIWLWLIYYTIAMNLYSHVCDIYIHIY